MGAVPLRAEEVAYVWCDVQGSEGAVIRTGVPLWSAGVPLYAEIAPGLIRRQERLEDFLATVRSHFTAFVEASQLVTQGPEAPLRPMSAFASLVTQLEAEGRDTDVLLVPA